MADPDFTERMAELDADDEFQADLDAWDDARELDEMSARGWDAEDEVSEQCADELCEDDFDDDELPEGW